MEGSEGFPNFGSLFDGMKAIGSKEERVSIRASIERLRAPN